MSHAQPSLAFHLITRDHLDNLRKTVSEIDQMEVMYQSDVNMADSIFVSKIVDLHKNCFSLNKARKLKRIQEPWIMQELLGKFRTKNMLYRQFLKPQDAI